VSGACLAGLSLPTAPASSARDLREAFANFQAAGGSVEAILGHLALLLANDFEVDFILTGLPPLSIVIVSIWCSSSFSSPGRSAGAPTC